PTCFPSPVLSQYVVFDRGVSQYVAISSVGQMGSPYVRFGEKRCERPPSKSAAKSMISSCKGLTLRSESAAIHWLTILGRAGSDELGGVAHTEPLSTPFFQRTGLSKDGHRPW